ncbi:hypothetical protein GALL_242640 [mine drainage metagenome]|uniref:Uncharacterized protein n=1 Tax=mine drainage metagenome TaxID=410659 RepID=A0A1J5RCF6_9ZZZZ
MRLLPDSIATNDDRGIKRENALGTGQIRGQCVREKMPARKFAATARPLRERKFPRAGLMLQCTMRSNTILPARASTGTTDFGPNPPSRMRLDSGFSIWLWIARLRGRAPNTGS